MTTRTKINKKYRRISNLAELQSERIKLENRIDIKEIELRHDVRMIENALSFENLLAAFTERFTGVGGVINGIVEGVSMVTSVINCFRGRSCG